MGIFLSIGIATKVVVWEKKVQQAKLNFVQLQAEMIKQTYFEPDLYDIIKNDDFYVFRIKNSVLKQELIPLLEKIYPLLYNNDNYYNSVIETLKQKPVEKWLEWARDKSEEAFQFDAHAEGDSIKADELSSSYIDISYDMLLLSMEGKIIMESYGRQFNFFKYSVIEAFKEYSLAKAIRIYITG